MRKSGQTKTKPLAAVLLSLAAVVGCSRGSSEDPLTPPSGVPANGSAIQPLHLRALERLSGEAMVSCDASPAVPLRFAVDTSGLQLGETRLPAQALESLHLAAREGTTLEVQAVARYQDESLAGADLAWVYTFDREGRLAALTADIPDGSTLTCTSADESTWPNLGGDHRTLVSDIAAPLASVAPVDMDCRTFVGVPVDGPMRVDYTNHQLSFRSEQAWASYGPVPFWSEPPAAVPYLQGVELIATTSPGSIDLLRFFRADSPERRETITIDPADPGALLTAHVSSRTVFINCERP